MQVYVYVMSLGKKMAKIGSVDFCLEKEIGLSIYQWLFGNIN